MKTSVILGAIDSMQSTSKEIILYTALNTTLLVDANAEVFNLQLHYHISSTDYATISWNGSKDHSLRNYPRHIPTLSFQT